MAAMWMAAASAVAGIASASRGAPSMPVMGAPASWDHSGWNVALGDGSRIDSARSESGGSGYLQYFIYGAAFLILWKLVKKS